MFLNNSNEAIIGEEYFIIGEVMRIEGDCVELEMNNNKFIIKHLGIDNYKSKYVIVHSTAEGSGEFTEIAVYKLDDTFSINNFAILAKEVKKLKNIF